MPHSNQLDYFAAIHNSNPIKTFEISRHAPKAIAPPFPLGATLTEYFSLVSFPNLSVTWSSLYLMLFGIEQLETALSAWRWIPDSSGNIVENPKWNCDWIIFADRNGDAISVDSSSPKGAVYGSIQSRHLLLSNSLGDFFETIAECMRIEHETYADDVMQEEDCTYSDAFLRDVEAAATRILGAECKNSFIQFFF